MGNRSAPPREDQRVRLTRQLLQNAFVEILAEKPVQRVSVVELCARAGVNRGTFYLHYHDVYDLLERMEADVLDDLDALLASTPVIVSGASREQGDGFIRALMAFFEKNREMCAILLGENGDRRFVADIIERAREKSVREYRQRYPGTSDEKVETFYYFVAWGFIGLLQRSLLHPQALSFERLALHAERILEQAARFFTEEQGG